MKQTNDGIKKLPLIISGAFVLVVSMWVLSLLIIIELFPDPKHMINGVKDISHLTARGTFGDMFGAVNALFSGLAFAGLIIAIYMQRKELEYQREELELTRKEFQKQTKEFEEQNKNLAIQRFENTFFSMVKLLNSIIDSISFEEVIYGAVGGFNTAQLQYMSPAQRTRNNNGREVFTCFRKQLVVELKNITSIENFSDKVSEFFLHHPYSADNYIGHYFKVIYSILKQIDQNKSLNFDEKKSYSNMLRSQLSCDELFLLFCNCLQRDEFILLKLLIEKYSFLKHFYNFEISDEIMQNYQPRAYQSRKEFNLHHYRDKLDALGLENFITED